MIFRTASAFVVIQLATHLDYIDCCLFVKGKEICICDRFLDKGHKITIPKSNGKLAHKKEVLQKPVQPEDPRLNSYVQTLTQMWWPESLWCEDFEVVIFTKLTSTIWLIFLFLTIFSISKIYRHMLSSCHNHIRHKDLLSNQEIYPTRRLTRLRINLIFIPIT